MAELNEIMHQTVRLRIMATLTALSEQQEVDFTYLRNLLDVTDGNLGAHLSKLEDAGFISMEKTFLDRKPHTYITATAKGRQVFKEHVTALRAILNGDN